MTATITVFRIATIVMVVSAVMTALGGMTYFQGSQAFEWAETALQLQDYTVLLLTTGLFVVSIALAALSRNNRILLPISVLFLTVNVLLAAVFSDVFSALAANPSLSPGIGLLPLSDLLLESFPVVMGVVGLVVIVATYTRLGVGGGRRAAR